MKIKRFAFLVLVLGITVFVIYNITKKTKTAFNDENTLGNTGGNLMNNGLFCEDGEKIYFSNLNDDGALYSMNLDTSDFKKVSEDKVIYINSAGKYIYYTRRNNAKEKKSPNVLEFNHSGIYRVDKDGSDIKSLYSKPSGIMALLGNQIYYQQYNDKTGLLLYKVKIDGTKEKKISNEEISPASIMDGVIYYSGIASDHNIHTLDLTTGFSKILLEENTYQSIAANDYIYYMSQSDDYHIYRIKKDGTNPEIVVPDRCSTYNISLSGKYLYYQVDDPKNNGIYRMNLETNETTNIITGNYNNINITSNYVFFQEFESNRTFILPVGEQGNLISFNPPVLKK